MTQVSLLILIFLAGTTLLIGPALANSQPAASNDCADGNGNVTSCLKDVKDSELTNFWHYVQADELEDTCEKVEETNNCLTRHNCDETMSVKLKGEWLGVKEAYGYICNEAKQDYMSHKDCWMSENINNELLNCYRDYDINHDEHTNDTMTCLYLNEWIECIDKVVDKDCTEEAEQIMNLFVLERVRPQAELIHCDITDGASLPSSLPLLTLLLSALLATYLPQLLPSFASNTL
jgi:hypothetical protein